MFNLKKGLALGVLFFFIATPAFPAVVFQTLGDQQQPQAVLKLGETSANPVPAVPAGTPFATSLSPDKPLSAVSNSAVTPPPGSYVDPATGSWAVKVANDFSGLKKQTPGTWEAFEQQIRSYAFQGVNLNNITTYNVYNNKGVLKRIEEYVFSDSCKTNLSKIVTRFYDSDRQIHVETFTTVKKSKCIGCFCWPAQDKNQIYGTFMTRWEIWDTHGKLSAADINHKTSDRKFSSVTGKNINWVSTVYDENGVKTRVYTKSGDNQNIKGVFYNPNGTILKTEYYSPALDPTKTWGPFYAKPRLDNPSISQLQGAQPVITDVGGNKPCPVCGKNHSGHFEHHLDWVKSFLDTCWSGWTGCGSKGEGISLIGKDSVH